MAQAYNDFAEENGLIDSLSEKEICARMVEKIKNEIMFTDSIFRRARD